MSKQMEGNNMKNFSNYTDFDTKENLHFESKAVHGALGTEPLTGSRDSHFPADRRQTWLSFPC